MHFDLVTFFVSQQVNFFIQRRHAVEREINHFYTYELLLNSSLRHYMFHLLHRYYIGGHLCHCRSPNAPAFILKRTIVMMMMTTVDNRPQYAYTTPACKDQYF